MINPEILEYINSSHKVDSFKRAGFSALTALSLLFLNCPTAAGSEAPRQAYSSPVSSPASYSPTQEIAQIESSHMITQQKFENLFAQLENQLIENPTPSSQTLHELLILQKSYLLSDHTVTTHYPEGPRAGIQRSIILDAPYNQSIALAAHLQNDHPSMVRTIYFDLNSNRLTNVFLIDRPNNQILTRELDSISGATQVRFTRGALIDANIVSGNLAKDGRMEQILKAVEASVPNRQATVKAGRFLNQVWNNNPNPESDVLAFFK